MITTTLSLFALSHPLWAAKHKSLVEDIEKDKSVAFKSFRQPRQIKRFQSLFDFVETHKNITPSEEEDICGEPVSKQVIVFGRDVFTMLEENYDDFIGPERHAELMGNKWAKYLYFYACGSALLPDSLPMLSGAFVKFFWGEEQCKDFYPPYKQYILDNMATVGQGITDSVEILWTHFQAGASIREDVGSLVAERIPLFAADILSVLVHAKGKTWGDVFTALVDTFVSFFSLRDDDFATV